MKRSIHLAVAGVLALNVMVGTRATATASPTDALKFFKNYFLTGDFVVGGVGLYGQGVGGTATGSIAIADVPPDADIAAAFLYWQVVSKNTLGPDAGGLGVTFRGNALSSAAGPFGKALGSGSSPCWSSGGGTGSSGGAHTTYSYRADVLRYFDVDPVTGKLSVNGQHQVQLPDDSNRAALGASLVVIYRDRTPGAPLSAIVLYDGTYTMDQRTESMSQTIEGFYDASDSASAKLTHIVGSGQLNKSERLYFNGAQIALNPFRSSLGDHWDNPTYSLTPDASLRSVTTSVDHTGFSSFDCLTWAAVVYRTTVRDTDGDGLLDVWERASSTAPVLDPLGRELPRLKDMHADPLVKDLFVEVGYMGTDVPRSYGDVVKPAHSHRPSHAALKLMGDAFKNAPTGAINVHFDLGSSYPLGDPEDSSKNAEEYIIRGDGLARGGEAIDEMSTVCARGATDPPWVCQFSGFPGTVGWKSGFRFLRDEVFSVTPTPPPTSPATPLEDYCDTPGYTCNRRFDSNRMDMFHYALFAHAVGLPKSDLQCLDSSGAPVADVNDVCASGVENPDFRIPRTNTGVGDFPGGDVLVTLGGFNDVDGLPIGTPFMQASTLMHEFGHNMERRHGGEALEPNCKPTYLSAMNYLYQLRGLPDDAGKPHLDFSPEVYSPALDEAGLSDGPLSLLRYRIGWYAPLVGSYLEGRGTAARTHCDGSPLNRDELGVLTEPAMVRIDARTRTAPIDWNANGVLDSGAQDINFNGRDTDELRGSDDWSNLRLNQIGGRRNVGGLYAIPGTNRFGVGPLSLDVGKGDLGKGDLGKGDLGKGDLGKGDLGKGDLGKGDLGKGDLGKGDLGKGDLGGGDLFSGDPKNPGGELDAETATDLAKTPPTEFRACVIGVDCSQTTPLHRVRLDWKSPNVGSVVLYTVYRLLGTELVPDTPATPWTNVGPPVTAVAGQTDYTLVDDTELANGVSYTYFAVATYPDTQSDPSNAVTITAVNDPPSAGNDSYTTPEDGTLTVTAPGVLVNDGDLDSAGGPAWTAVLATSPAHGTLTLNADGSFTYAPSANYNGPDSFTYKANNGTIDTNIATVSISVTPVNDAPIANSQSVSTAEDTPVAITLTASDVDGDALTYVIVSSPAHGTLTGAAANRVYTPALNYNGADSFTFKANDGSADSAAVTVAISIAAVNDAPVAAGDSYSTVQGAALTVAAPGVLSNDTDVDSSLTAVLATQAANGTVTLNANGSFTYTPNVGFYGTDSFTYNANDGASSASATVTITVRKLTYTFANVQNLPPPSGKSFSVGSSVPLRWQFFFDGVVYPSMNAMPQIVVVSPAGTVVYLGSPSDPGSSSFQAPTAANGYTWQFNWQTKNLAAGKYQVYVGSLQTGQVYPAGAFGPFQVTLK